MAKTKIKADSIQELCSIAKAKLLLKSEEDVEVSWTSESTRMNVIIEVIKTESLPKGKDSFFFCHEIARDFCLHTSL